MHIDDGRVVPNFIAQALQGDPLTVYGDGGQTRSFCYVKDLVEGIYRLLRSNEVEPVNIGNPSEMTILEFAQKIIKLTGSNSEITFITPTDMRIKDDPKVRQPDIGKARRILNWEPQVALDDGLHKTIEYFKTRV
jgi:dTDP-glucose 4,6-dehydratase